MKAAPQPLQAFELVALDVGHATFYTVGDDWDERLTLSMKARKWIELDRPVKLMVAIEGVGWAA